MTLLTLCDRSSTRATHSPAQGVAAVPSGLSARRCRAGCSGAARRGQLSRDEHDTRLESALSARTYADLDRIVTDLLAAQAAVPSPAGPAMVTPPARINAGMHGAMPMR